MSTLQGARHASSTTYLMEEDSIVACTTLSHCIVSRRSWIDMPSTTEMHNMIGMCQNRKQRVRGTTIASMNSKASGRYRLVKVLKHIRR